MAKDVKSLREATEKLLARDPLEMPMLPTAAVQRLVKRLHAREIELECLNQKLISAERELEASRDRYAELYNCAPTGYIVLDAQGNILEANLAACVMVGVLHDNLVPHRAFADLIAHGSTELWERFCSDLLELRHEQNCELTLTRQDAPAWVANIEGAVLHPEDPERCRFMIQVVDVTDRKRTEIQIRQSQNLETVGRLAGGVVHDFSNLLMAIMGYVELCHGELPPGHPVREWLDVITDATRRSAELIRQLLAFSRKQVVVPTVVNVNSAVSDLLPSLNSMLGEPIELSWQPDQDVWPVKVDPTQFDRVLTGLCANCRDAIEEAGSVHISSTNVLLDDTYCTPHRNVLPGEYAMVTISDDGHGMNRETLAHVFEPFFTTKDVGRGTGMDLAVIHGLVVQNAGHIDLDSEQGKGATVRIYFPRHVA